MKLKDLQKEFERAKKNLIKIEKLIDELENESENESENENEFELKELYKDAKEIENEMEIYQYLAYKYFEEVLK